MEAMGLAMFCPSMSGAEPCTLGVSDRPTVVTSNTETDIRLAHHKVVTGVDGWHEAERADESGGAVTIHQLCNRI